MSSYIFYVLIYATSITVTFFLTSQEGCKTKGVVNTSRLIKKHISIGLSKFISEARKYPRYADADPHVPKSIQYSKIARQFIGTVKAHGVLAFGLWVSDLSQSSQAILT